jgi:long-chain acyl-CoA synthetase
MSFAHRTLGRSDSPSASDVTCWVFDVDGTLVDSLTGTSLRPGTRDLLAFLAAQDARVLFWSAGGHDYAVQRADQFEVESLVNGFFAKEGRDASGFYITSHLALGSGPTVFVDDRPEDLSPDLTVVAVPPYLVDDPHDRGLRDVAWRAGLHRERS